MEDEWITKPKKQKSPSSQSSKKSSPPAKRLAKKSPSASKGMQQSIDTFFSRAKKTDESQSESQSTPTKVSDTISPNKRKHEGDEEESPKRRKIEKTPEKTQEIDMTPVEDEVNSHKEFLDTFFGSDDEGETNRSPTKFPKKKEQKREEQDSLFDSSDDEKKTNNNNNTNKADDSDVEGESIKSSSESLFSQEDKDEPSDDFMEAAKPGDVSAVTTQSYETVHVDPSAPVQRKKAYKKKKNVPADATAAEMIEKSKPKPAPKPPRSALPALIKGPSDPALLATSDTLVDKTPVKPASTETKKTPPAAHSKTSPTTKQSDAFIDACANSLAFAAFKQAVYDPKHQYICWSVIDKVDGNIFRRIESPQKINTEKSVAVREARGIVIYPTKANKPYFVNLKPSAPKDDQVDFVPVDERYNFLIEFLESDKIKNKICYDTKNALKPLFSYNMKMRPLNLLDPQIAAWVYSPEDESYNFLALVEKYLAEKIEQPTLFTSPYAILFKDMMLCFRLMVHLENFLEKEGLMKIFAEQEMAVVPILSKMEIWGMGFDNEELLKCEQTLQKKLLDLQNEAERVTGQSVPLTSPQRISAILFDKLRLKPETKKERVGKKGQQSTNEAVLKTLQKQHPLPGIVLQHRHIQKMLTNWIETLDKKQIKGRIHTTLLHTGTATGRLSSQNPNLQNLPRTAQTFSLESNTNKDKEKDKETPAPVVVNVRDAFVAAEGYVLLAADYSQLEMRLMAHIAKDQTLKTFFNSGKDVHTLVASHWRKKPVDQVTNTEREQAKRLVYGIMYGMGPNSLSEILDVTKKEAKEFIDSFLHSYPEVNEFIEETRREAHKNLSVRTITNRRRLLPGINGEDANKAERQAVNTVIQGTAADVVKMAMIKVDEKIHDSTTRLLLQIHDELIYEVEEKNIEELAKILKSTMESVIELDVPLPVNLKMGKRWGSMKGLPVK